MNSSKTQNLKRNELVLHSEFDSLWEFPPETNASDYVLRKVKEHGDNFRTCVRNAITGEEITYREVEKLSRKFGSKLSKLGLEFGDTVIYSTHDPVHIHCFILGVWRANGVVRSSYPEDIGEVLVKRIKESKAKFLACDKHLINDYKEAAAAVKDWSVTIMVFGNDDDKPNYQQRKDKNLIFLNDFLKEEDYDGSLSLPESKRKLSDIALILPTSGTTGESKGAIYTHKTVLENLIAFENLPFTDKDEEPTIITSRQTHFVGSLVGLSFLTRGRYLITMPFVTVEGLLEAVEKWKVRAIVGFPKYLTGLVTANTKNDLGQYDTSSLKYLASAGQVLVPETMSIIKKLPTLKTFINLYGMTEAGLLATSADWSSVKNGIYKAIDEERDYTVGKLPPNTSLKVLDIESGELLGPYCKGELYFKTPVIIQGYLNRPEDEGETFHDGWVNTGDVGYYDEDGFIFIVDRAKDIFKYYNNHISPSEIESVFLRHPQVAEAVVVGIPDPDGGGSIPRAFIVLKRDTLSTTANEQDLLLFAKNYLPPYKQPNGGIFILPQIPIGKTGKVTRKLVSEMIPCTTDDRII